MAPSNDVLEVQLSHAIEKLDALHSRVNGLEAKYDGHIRSVIIGALAVAGFIILEPLKRVWEAFK
jgi:hypothetical protein